MSDDPNADRVIQLSLSKNGSHTYGDPRYYALPVTGDFKKRIVSRRWGQMVQGVWKIECTSPVDLTLIAASIETE